MAREITLLRVFVASPEDVKEERIAVDNAVRELNYFLDRDNIQLKVVKWETDVTPGVGEDQQDVINQDIGDDYDIFVGIMWRRFGTPTNRADSGTAEEFINAYERYQKNPDSLRIMFYFNQAPIIPEDIDPEQLMSLNKFKEQLGEQGVLYWTYNGVDDFERLLKIHLNKKIKEWGKNWGINSSTSEILEVTNEEIEENGFNDEDNYGFIELIEIGTDNFDTSNEAIARISEAIETIGNKIKERGEEFQQSQTPTPNIKQGKIILNRIADDMEQFVNRVKPEIPIFSEGFSKGIDAMTRATVMVNDFEGENEEQIVIALNTIKGIRTSMIPALEGMKAFRDSVYNVPRISRNINRSKRNMVIMVDELINEINSANDLALEAEKTLERALRDYRSHLTQINPKKNEENKN